VTGFGVVSPLGLDVASTWESLKKGQSGVDFIKAFNVDDYETKFASEVKGFDPLDYLDKKTARRTDRFVHFATAAAQQAISQANLNVANVDPYRTGVLIGSGIGGILTLSTQHEILLTRGPRRVSPFLIPMMLGDTASAHVSMLSKALGTNLCMVSSCSSGADAIGNALELISRGEADIIIAGGSEAPICPIAVSGFGSLRALSRNNDYPQKASRPFDSERDGFVMGEGAAILLLESQESVVRRGATPLAELAGYGSTSDGFHITEPAPSGESAAKAITKALARAGIEPKEVDYINAHGTSTLLNDRQETLAIKLALGPEANKIPISSTKSMTGHLLGAGGALEAVICIKAMEDGTIPPTINLDYPDPSCDLDYTPHRAKPKSLEITMSNSFGFGGHNSVLIFSKYSN